MKAIRVFATLVAILLASVTIVAAAAQKPGAKPPVSAGAPKGVAPKSTAPTSAVPKSAVPKSAAPKGTAAAAAASKGKNAAADKPGAAVSGVPAHAGRQGTSGDPVATETDTTVSTAAPTTGEGTVTTADPNPISMKIANNPNQKARVEAMLPAGMTIEQASAGFRNQGQFIAALNVSKNHNLNFADLQKAMTVDGMTLGQAVQQLKNQPAVPPQQNEN